MNAKRCDKCKTFYLPINPPDEHDILRIERETLFEGVLTYTNYDLCGECAKKNDRMAGGWQRMTNREKIAEMKVVDFFQEYAYDDCKEFTRFICRVMSCDTCPNPCSFECSDCYEKIDAWLDKEVSE